MQIDIQLQVLPEIAIDQKKIQLIAARKAAVKSDDISFVEVLKKSIDARSRQPKVNLKLRLYVNEPFVQLPGLEINYPNVADKEEVIVVGAGPAGLFAALRLIELGLKPVVIERGKDVRGRRRDLAAINKEHVVNPESNYCFGEGGAGTYSDGKLYTRSKKRGDVNRILEVLVQHGADRQILIDAHPHIGTNKLPQIIVNMRERILAHGGEVLFDTKMTDLLLEQNAIVGVQTACGGIRKSKAVILATGHSARDIFELLHKKTIRIEAKPFALGVRVEHTQQLIDRIQYHCENRGEYLPPAPYSIVKQVNGRGVYSFCMCPGGIIAPCATDVEEVVTNGWSPSKRDQKTANSGIVVELRTEDFSAFQDAGPLAGMEFQKAVEKKAWQRAGELQKVPAQRLIDFTKGIQSKDLPKTSYVPGLVSVELGEVLPRFVYKALQKAFIQFGKSMPGYLTNDAVVHAPESRTSSPVRIPRDKESLCHPEIKGLFPCGEGAGYAGGIVSAAIDGEKCALAILAQLEQAV